MVKIAVVSDNMRNCLFTDEMTGLFELTWENDLIASESASFKNFLRIWPA
jgi:hypothetical protein